MQTQNIMDLNKQWNTSVTVENAKKTHVLILTERVDGQNGVFHKLAPSAHAACHIG